MKAVISTNYSDTYLFFLPITTWCWNRLGIDVICFMPDHTNIAGANPDKLTMILHTCMAQGLNPKIKFFKCPEHKEATYAQVSRLYGACLDLPEDECLIVGDVDMAVFTNEFNYLDDGRIHSVGYDLLDTEQMKQIPMCYLAMQVKDWRKVMDIDGRSYQQCLDDVVGVIECDHFRGNQWSLDQFTAYSQFKKHAIIPVAHNRAKLPERFAKNRLDRDDSYILTREVKGVLDYHMNRPGFEHIETILSIFGKIYPDDNFDWILEYTHAYKQLL